MHYRAIRTVRKDRISYGIVAVRDNKEFLRFEDITEDFETILKMTMEFNTEELDPIHLEEVLEVFLETLEY